MEKLAEIAELVITCGTVLAALFMILLAMPKCYLRNFLVQIIGWALSIFCGVYVVSPIDVIPDFIPFLGWIDDGGAMIAGLTSGVMAYTAGQDNKRLKHHS